MSEFEVFSDPYFHAFGLNTDQKSFEYRRSLRSASNIFAIDTGRKLSVHKTFNLRPVSTEEGVFLALATSITFMKTLKQIFADFQKFSSVLKTFV